jgi:hypothetical protein
MTEAAPTPVAELKSRLSAVNRQLADAIGEAAARADELIAEPTVERQKAKNAAVDACELLDLTAKRIQRDLEAAQKAEHLAALEAIGVEHAQDVAQVPALVASMSGAAATLETAVAAADGVKRRSAKRMHAAKGHHLAAGLEESEAPWFGPNLPRLGDLRGRLTKLLQALDRLEQPPQWS